MEKPRSYMIENATFNWVRLDTPNEYLGVKSWDVQIETEDPKVAKEWDKNHLKVKQKDGKFQVSLRRKVYKKDGTEDEPVRLVDENKNPIFNRNKIGNGSTGNAIVRQFAYDNKFGKGISTSLTAVQITNLVVYEVDEMDFKSNNDEGNDKIPF